MQKPWYRADMGPCHLQICRLKRQKKCQKIVNIGVMRKDRAAQQRLFSGTILRGLTQPLNAYGYKYFSLLLLLFYAFVVAADLSEQAKSAAAADGLT
jgi:hypothetical protein